MTTSELKKRILDRGKRHNININLEKPVTIQDKINWLKCYDVTPLKTKCADKISVHDYVKEKLGVDICVPIIKIYDSVDSINLDELPQQFVLKCNHGWDMNIICKDKSKFNLNDAKRKLKKWLNTNFGKNSTELHYSKIEPKCYAEMYLQDDSNALTDYKFWCFNGTVKLCNLYCEHGNNYYDLDFNLLDINNANAPADFNKKYTKPKNFDKMIEYATILSKDFKFVRVDFYEVNGVVYIGEMTFTPGNGFMHYDKHKTSVMIGNMLEL